MDISKKIGTASDKILSCSIHPAARTQFCNTGSSQDFIQTSLLCFCAAALTFAKDEKYPGAIPVIIIVLHIWKQQLNFHPHIHCNISGGGIASDNTWKEAKRNT